MPKLTLTLPLLFLAAPILAAPSPTPELVPWANKFFSGKAEAPPPVILHDFGTVPKGTVKVYRFEMANIYAVPMQIREPQPSCGCVSVLKYTAKLDPRETGFVEVEMNTKVFDGYKAVKIPVKFTGRDPKTGEQFFSDAQLEVRARSQADVAINPGAFEFGQIPAGQKAASALTVTYTGRQPGWKITEVGYRKELFDVTVDPLEVTKGAAYKVTVTLKPGTPNGQFNEQLVLKTNEPGVKAALSLNISGTIQPTLSIAGSDLIRFNGVDFGKKEERRVTVQAESEFKVKEVEGQGDGITVTLLPIPASKKQIITVTFAPEKVGPVKKVLTIKTDNGKSVSLTVEAIGKEPQ
ncbi:MAG TPA: DUF1573 domain-containing protein [Gemmataceae bacterium]|jgi:hypothetical protein|nr:DUF1573 domain-containing protein [Gemmataceae bacterium]